MSKNSPVMSKISNLLLFWCQGDSGSQREREEGRGQREADKRRRRRVESVDKLLNAAIEMQG